jgi:AcrR family transcriptional regulator
MSADQDFSGPAQRPLRRDAQRNRDAILAAARTAFAAEGISTPLDGVARAAGVSIGTLYRNFPRRVDLMRTVFDDRLRECVAAGERAVAAEDPWSGFAGFIERLSELQAHDRGLNDLLSMDFGCDWSTEAHDRLQDLSEQIVARAHADGSLRADVTAADLTILAWSYARIIHATRTTAPAAWRRQLALALDGFRAERAHPLPEPPLDSGQVRVAMASLGASISWG